MSSNEELTYFYSENYLNYIAERYELENNSYINKSKEYNFYAPILNSNGKVQSGELSYLSIPYVEGKISEKCLKKEMNNYLEKVNELGLKRVALRQDPLINYNNQIIKSLLKDNFIPNIFYTSVVDLTLSEEKLHQNLRKSYHSLINSFYKEPKYKLFVVDKNNNFEKIEDWINLYMALISRGGGTPSRDKFKNIEASIKENLGHLYLLFEDEKLTSGVHINFNGKSAYYSASGTHPDFEGKNFYSHFLLWESIKALKEKGFTSLEIGPIFYDNVKNFYSHSEKELKISDFKLGMGGNVKPFFIYEKV